MGQDGARLDHEPDAVDDFAHSPTGERSDFLDTVHLVNREHLQDVDYALFRQTAFALAEASVTGKVCQG